MIFLYSRKSQLVLLLCWLIGMTVMYVQITGERPLWLAKASERIVDHAQKARLGRVPDIEPAVPQAPAPPPLPAADPVLNRCLAMRTNQSMDEQADTLAVDLDYIAAQKKGFSLEKAHGYYLEDAPTFVVAFGEPWISDIGHASFPGAMQQVTGLELIVSKSKHLRLLVHTRSMRIARGAKFHISPTETGLRVEIRLPR